MFFKKSKKKINNLSDENLTELCKKGEHKEAFGEIYARYAHLVYGLCLKYLKDEALSRDAVGDIFEKLPKEIQKTEIKYFKSWLYQVAKNHCLMYLRKNKFFHEEINAAEEKNSENFMDFSLAEHLLDETENLFDAVKSAVESLKNGQKKCVELFFWEGKSYREISAETGYTDNDVKSFLQNGKRNIKKFLETIRP